MARPREFDETTVLEAAMNCFWAQGFEQTSVRDLAEWMGITGASLYNAFGDKRSLYRRAFVYYLAQTVHDRVARLDARPADELAKLLLSVLLGIRVLARTRPQREVLEGAGNGVLALLGIGVLTVLD